RAAGEGNEAVSTALCLASYALVVTVPAPWLLTRVAGGGCAPRLGILAWLLAVGTVVASVLAAAVALIQAGDVSLVAAGWATLTLVIARFSWAAAVTGRATRARRASHRQMLVIVGRPDRHLGATLVDAAEPLVYCLPAPTPTVVITTGARQALTSA